MDSKEDQYCPVHNIKCKELESTKRLAMKRVPIWAFYLFVGGSVAVAGWLNLASIERHERSMKVIESHIITSNSSISGIGSILGRATHALNEIAFNQRVVMQNLELDFQEIPDYELEGGGGSR